MGSKVSLLTLIEIYGASRREPIMEYTHAMPQLQYNYFDTGAKILTRREAVVTNVDSPAHAIRTRRACSREHTGIIATGPAKKQGTYRLPSAKSLSHYY